MIFLVTIAIVNVSFAATDNVKKNSRFTASFHENDYKSGASNLKIKDFSPYVNKKLIKKDMNKYYIFTTKTKNYKIKWLCQNSRVRSMTFLF